MHAGDNVDVDEGSSKIVIRPAPSLAELIGRWDDLATHLSDAQLALDLRDERDARAAYL